MHSLIAAYLYVILLAVAISVVVPMSQGSCRMTLAA